MAFQDASATFTGSEAYVDITWPAAYVSYQIAQSVLVTDGSGDVVVNVINKTSTGVRVVPSAPFTGSVYLLAYEV